MLLIVGPKIDKDQLKGEAQQKPQEIANHVFQLWHLQLRQANAYGFNAPELLPSAN